MQGIHILLLALVMTLAATALPGLSEWRRALTRNRQAALIPVLALAGTMLGSTEAASLAGGIPNPLRLVRAGVFVFLFLFSAFRLMTGCGSWRNAGAGIKGMALFGVLGITSAIWSIAPFISVWKGFEVLTLSLAIMSVTGRMRNTEDAVWLSRLLGLVLMYLCMTVLAGLILDPSAAIKNPDTTYTQYYFAVRGLVPIINPSSVGSLSGLLFILSVSPLLTTTGDIRIRRTGLYFAATFAVIMMILAHSRTPIIACTAALILMLVYAHRWKYIFAVGGIGAILLLATSFESLVQHYIMRGQTAEAFITLTGRIGFWEKVMEQIATSPVIGHGYYAGQRMLLDVSSVDNTYLEVLIGLGFVGLAVFIFPLVWATLRIYFGRLKNSKIEARQMIWLQTAGAFTLLVIRSLTGPSFEVMHPLLVVYLIVLSFTALLHRLRNVPASGATEINKSAIAIKTVRSGSNSVLRYKSPPASLAKR